MDVERQRRPRRGRRRPSCPGAPGTRRWTTRTRRDARRLRRGLRRALHRPERERRAATRPSPCSTTSNGNGVCDGGYSARRDVVRGRPTTRRAKRTDRHAPRDARSRRPRRPTDAASTPAGASTTSSTSPARRRRRRARRNPPFERDLTTTTVDVPEEHGALDDRAARSPALRTAFETAAGAGDGDATDRDRSSVRDPHRARDLTTGTMWPDRERSPTNLSRACVVLLRATPRPSRSASATSSRATRATARTPTPTATGRRSRNGYNWFFDNFNTSGDAAGAAGSPSTRRASGDGWEGRSQRRRRAAPRCGSGCARRSRRRRRVYTTLTGFSYYYLSLGGDVGYDSANGFASSIPMDGTPVRHARGDVFEDTITERRHAPASAAARSTCANDGGTGAGDPLGRLLVEQAVARRALPGRAPTPASGRRGATCARTRHGASTYRLVRRGDRHDGPAARRHELLARASAARRRRARTRCFNVGTSVRTHVPPPVRGRRRPARSSSDGPQLAANYNFPPARRRPRISRPFGLATNGAGGTGPTSSPSPTDYPRFTAPARASTSTTTRRRTTGSGLVRLSSPGASPRAALRRRQRHRQDDGSGSAFIARYSLITLVHGFLAAGVPAAPAASSSCPRVQISRADDRDRARRTRPRSTCAGRREWKRWDGQPYTTVLRRSASPRPRATSSTCSCTRATAAAPGAT